MRSLLSGREVWPETQNYSAFSVRLTKIKPTFPLPNFKTRACNESCAFMQGGHRVVCSAPISAPSSRRSSRRDMDIGSQRYGHSPPSTAEFLNGGKRCGNPVPGTFVIAHHDKALTCYLLNKKSPRPGVAWCPTQTRCSLTFLDCSSAKT